MIILVKLIFAHLVGDFLLQPKAWVNKKEEKKLKSFELYLHLLIHGLLILLVLWDLNYFIFAVLVTVSHGVIDVVKLYAQNEKNKSQWFFIDQILHILSIGVLWLVEFTPQIEIPLWGLGENIWIYLIAILTITSVSGIAIRELLLSWTKALGEQDEESLKNAGKYIGWLERLLIFIFVLIGRWEGVGFLLAAKSVFRFGNIKESKDRKLTEYILIGTLLSFAIAMVAGLLVRAIIGIDEYV